MEKEFENYLIEKGYKQYTDRGARSTVYDYIKRINHISKWENTDWYGIANNIDSLLYQYDVGGAKQELGEKSHRAVINALKAFADFITHR